jgi:HlyD family type I secretion membrane fusion protein
MGVGKDTRDGMMTVDKSMVPDWKRPARLGYLVIFLAFGVVGGWSAFARLDSAIVAPGVVTVESNRKTIQHFEGGIVREILVREGQHVEEDEVLFRLDGTQSQANADVARNQLAANMAQEARLIAERDGAEDITFPIELMNNIDQRVVKEALADQRKQFTERRASLNGQIAILQSRVKQYNTEIEGLGDEKAATIRQLNSIGDELVDLRYLREQRLVVKSRVMALEREQSRLEGIVGRSIADASKAQNGIGEADLQIDQLKKKFSEEVNAAVVEVRQKISDLREKVTVSKDILRRIEIRAPRSGGIQNVRVATIGGIIRAGEALLELIPDGDGLVINVQVSPMDIDTLQPDMPAEVRFSSFHAQNLPVVMGQVASVSRDRLTDEQSKQPYFLARVVVADEKIPSAIRGRIKAGMPADVIIPTGEQTVMGYLIRPLRNRASKALREQ